jgi:hypothetical protein
MAVYSQMLLIIKHKFNLMATGTAKCYFYLDLHFEKFAKFLPAAKNGTIQML